MGRQWAIGDIHGCRRTFQRLVEEQLQPSRSDVLYLLGDYVSKGPDSKGVIDYIWQLQREGYRVVCLQGNHEEMLLKAATDAPTEQRLLQNGGDLTLRSFGVTRFGDIPVDYRSWMQGLQQSVVLEGYVLVHAGLNFDLPDPFADQRAMRWLRQYTVQPEKIGGRILIHGHTPVALSVIQQQLSARPRTEINLDNGCAYLDREDQGRLAALELGSRRLVLQPNVEGD